MGIFTLALNVQIKFGANDNTRQVQHEGEYLNDYNKNEKGTRWSAHLHHVMPDP